MPTPERDGGCGTDGDNRGGGAETGHPGRISRPSGVASLAFISSVAVSGGEEEDDLKVGGLDLGLKVAGGLGGLDLGLGFADGLGIDQGC